MLTGYVLDSLALEVDTISLPLRQTYGHNHTILENLTQEPKLSQKCLRANNHQLFAIKFI
jgi:hypothetical protein